MMNFQNKAKIVKVSKVIRYILFAGLVLWAIGIPVVLFHIIVSWTTGTIVVPVSKAFCLQSSLILVLVFRFMVNLYLFRFFDRLKNGHLFDVQTIGNIDAAGKLWIVLWLFEVLQYEIGGPEIFQASNAWTWSTGGLFTGLVLIFAAWLLKEAQEIQEEQELTV